ncbi:MAG: 1-acyl-sn-glycerol-3-phosphate acyltransferase [Gammaproteobacteria bacterium]|nr:1-acyl-sn-glycerol-3-phosphate acyltransferase [Gammaproteobacteria bacterium]
MLRQTRQANKTLVAIRSFLYWILLTVSTVIWAWPILLSAVFPLQVRFKIMRVWPRFNMWALKTICGIRYRVEGLENLPKEPSIIFAKHASTWETIALQLLIPPAVYVAKKQLLYIPFFGWAMAVLNFVTIDRSAGRRAIVYMVEQAKDRLARGFWIIIFPEGTRKPIDAEPDYKIGGAVMAAKTGAKVVPVAHNAGIFWPRHSFLKWPGEVTVWFGPAIETNGLSAEEIRRTAQKVIESKMQELIR